MSGSMSLEIFVPVPGHTRLIQIGNVAGPTEGALLMHGTEAGGTPARPGVGPGRGPDCSAARESRTIIHDIVKEDKV